MARRSWKDHPLFWLFALIPLFGPLLYLCVRPPLPEIDPEVITNQQKPA